MDIELQKKVEQLKNCFSVEGSLLIKSNRFTQEELDEMFKNRGTTHESHFSHLRKTEKTFSDDEIADQIYTMLNQVAFSEQPLQDKMNLFFNECELIDMKSEKKLYKKKVYNLIGWDKLKPLNNTFWREFGSAPINGLSTSNKKLMMFKDKYGACAMEDIFGYKFSRTYFYTYTILNNIKNFDEKWKEANKIKNESEKVYTSPYKNIDDLEENISVKRIKDEARKFYLDKSKNFKDRVDVFNKYGESHSYIYHPKNSNINKIFDIYQEMDYTERHQNVECESIISFWIDSLTDDRCEIDYSRNSYHPSLKKTKRKYKPSKKAIDRLYKYYMEKLFLEGMGSFEWDW